MTTSYSTTPFSSDVTITIGGILLSDPPVELPVVGPPLPVLLLSPRGMTIPEPAFASRDPPRAWPVCPPSLCAFSNSSAMACSKYPMISFNCSSFIPLRSRLDTESAPLVVTAVIGRT